MGSFAQESRNGYWLPPYDTLRIFLVYAELTGDPDDPASFMRWKRGELPPDPGYLFDYEVLPGKEPRGRITSYFHQASFGRYIVLADHYPEIVSIDYNRVRGDGFNQVIDAINEQNRDDIVTSHGYSVNRGDFDRLTTSGHGRVKPLEKDSYIDVVMVIWRVNSKITRTTSAGYCVPSKRNYSLQDMKGMNSYSSFVMKDHTNYSIVRHEFSHMLLGGNNFHTGGSGAGTKTFMSSAGGYAMLSSWDSSSPVYTAFDRRRLGWKSPGNQYLISAREPGSGNEIDADLAYPEDPVVLETSGSRDEQESAGKKADLGDLPTELILRDFVETGDAIRIRLPYLKDYSSEVMDQWLWLENHQKLEGNIDHKPNMARGIYAYIQVGKETLSGSATYGGLCNYSWPLAASGNYDWIIDEETREYHLVDDRMNPFTGYNTLVRGAYDLGEKDGKIFRDELFAADNMKINGRYPDSALYNYMTYPIFGTGMDGFRPGDKIGIDRNPAPVPVLTWQTAYSNRNVSGKPRSTDNRVIHLNGISVEIIEQLPDGSIMVRLRWDDLDIGRNTRWCGDIQLHDDLRIKKKVKIRLDHGLTPVRPSDPVLLNGEYVFADPTSLALTPGATIRMEKKSRIYLEKGSSLLLADDAGIEMERRARIVVADSSGIILGQGAIISGKGKIYLSGDPDASLEKGLSGVKIRKLR
jgi:hypothetical protein